MRALIVRAPYAAQIMNDLKPIEYRCRATNVRGRIGIIEGGTGTVIGEVTLTGCQPGEGCYNWLLSNSLKYTKPRPYRHPPGAVVWVNLAD